MVFFVSPKFFCGGGTKTLGRRIIRVHHFKISCIIIRDEVSFLETYGSVRVQFIQVFGDGFRLVRVVVHL